MDFYSKVGPSIFDLHTETCCVPHTPSDIPPLSESLLSGFHLHVICHTHYTVLSVFPYLFCVTHSVRDTLLVMSDTHYIRDPLPVMCHTLYQGFITCYVPHTLPGIHYLLCATHSIRDSLLVMCHTLYQ